MSFLFHGYKRPRITAIDFAVEATSPGMKCVLRVWALLSNMDHPDWAAYALGREWSCDMIAYAVSACFTLLGNVYLRLVRPYLGWPWRLAHLVSPAVADDLKQAIA
eukprot:6772698-Alexandrium_andersonii.AAC.1